MARTTHFFVSCPKCRVSQSADWYLTPNLIIRCEAGHRMIQRAVHGRIGTQECTTSCVNAKGSDCECSCGGKDHGRYA